jgi:NAD(P)-dependent dehydrogenase (short-subunit alcohol dehydrogenase family)
MFEPLIASPGTGVIVTGGASGIGRASAQALAAVGRPVAVWDVNGGGAESAAAEIKEGFGVAAIGVGVDLRDPAALVRAVEQTRAALPSIGGLVHAAGIVQSTFIKGVTPQNWDDNMNIHVRPLILITQAIRDDLKANASSAIVAIASMNATLGNGAIPAYTAAKGALISLVLSMADELGRHGVRVNAVSPGMTDTPMLHLAIPDYADGHLERRILLGRLGRPGDVARVVRFLMSEEASYITATELVVDGGNISSQR